MTGIFVCSAVLSRNKYEERDAEVLERVQHVYNIIDRNSNGLISFLELVKWWKESDEEEGNWCAAAPPSLQTPCTSSSAPPPRVVLCSPRVVLCSPPPRVVLCSPHPRVVSCRVVPRGRTSDDIIKAAHQTFDDFDSESRGSVDPHELAGPSPRPPAPRGTPLQCVPTCQHTRLQEWSIWSLELRGLAILQLSGLSTRRLQLYPFYPRPGFTRLFILFVFIPPFP